MSDNVRPWDMLRKEVPKAPEEVVTERLSICAACPSLKLGICMECGCKMKWKTKLSMATCPLHKWEAHLDNIHPVGDHVVMYNGTVVEQFLEY